MGLGEVWEVGADGSGSSCDDGGVLIEGSTEWQVLQELAPCPDTHWNGRCRVFKTNSLDCTVLALWAAGMQEAWIVLTDRGLWSPELFGAIVRNRWHPLMRINAQGNFRPLWGRQKRAFASWCPARAGQQVVIAGEAFRYRLRCS